LSYCPIIPLEGLRKISVRFVGFEVLTAVVRKSSIFWDVTPHSPLKVGCRFGGTCLLHLQGLLAICFHAGFVLGLFFMPEDGGNMFLLNVS
jgi:hypothetical protein